MEIKRRRFLGQAVLGAGGAMVSGSVGAQESATAPASTNPTDTVSLGKEQNVCRIGMGLGVKAYERVSQLTKRGEKHADDMMRYAYDQDAPLFYNTDL